MDFRILGPLEAHDGDRPLALGGAKQRALLGLLLLHANETVSSDRLVDELWAAEGRSGGSKALRVAIARLRRVIEPNRATGEKSRTLVTRPPGYELRVEPSQLDLYRFEELVSKGRRARDAAAASDAFREALAIWRGPPLSDLTYESFAQSEIARLDELHTATVEDRIAADLELGRHADVIGELQALVGRQPLRERLGAQLMLALYRSGRQAEALEVYRNARRALVDELGIEPARELQELEVAILAQDPALSLPERGRAPAQGQREASSAGFVGRETEMTELLSLLDGARSGSGALVLIGGEPGIGKSRLAEELAGRAQSRGDRVLVGRCWEAGGAPPYWPWAQALRSHARDTDPDALRSQVGAAGAGLATIVPELRELLHELPPAPPLESEGARFRLFESVAQLLERAAAAGPLTLFFDDLHAADAPSLLLLRFVARGLGGSRILIVGCYRDTELGPGQPLAETLPELAREAAVRRISLKGLGPPETSRLLELTTKQLPPEELVLRVHAGTEGNPLFAVELGRLLASEGGLDKVGDSHERLPIPDGIREAIGQRLRRQSDPCRQALRLASVIGREFDVDLVERIGQFEQDELFAALDEAAATRLVSEVPGTRGRLRFSHMLIRDVLYDDLSTTRRRRLHRETAEALEALHARNLEPHLAELAHHYVEAGAAEAEKAVRYGARAGDRAAEQLGYEEAARHYASTLRLLETTDSGEAREACELLLSLGEVLSRAGEASGAKEAFRRAATIAESSVLPEELARAALGYGGRFVWARAGSDPFLVPLYERALAAVGEHDSPARVRLLARLATAIRDEPLRDRRLGLAQEALEMAKRIGDPVTLAFALEGYWPAVEGPDSVESRIGGANELIALAEEIGDKERGFQGHDYRLNSFWTLADRAAVDVGLDALGRLAEELRQPAQRWHVVMQQAMLMLMEGRFGRAEQLISEAVALGGQAQSWNATVSQRLALFVLRREQGRLAELEEVIERSVHEYPALRRFQCALAHLYAELGRERDARSVLDDLLTRDLANEYLDAEWLFAMSMLPDVAAFLGDVDAAGRLYELLLPYEAMYAEAPVEGVFGSVARGLGVLARTLGRFDAADRHFEVALEVEQRMRARPWLAHAQEDYARMLVARGADGDRHHARELLGAAVSTYRELAMEVHARRAAALLAAAG
jgi:DNA-binding SARP family transcriptional activator/tetratricopeptide (TPR) repeat protein